MICSIFMPRCDEMKQDNKTHRYCNSSRSFHVLKFKREQRYEDCSGSTTTSSVILCIRLHNETSDSYIMWIRIQFMIECTELYFLLFAGDGV